MSTLNGTSAIDTSNSSSIPETTASTSQSNANSISTSKNTQVDDELLNLHILLKEQRLPLALSASATLIDLYTAVEALCPPEVRNQRIRLLYGGRFLAREVRATLRGLGMADGAAVHCLVTDGHGMTSTSITRTREQEGSITDFDTVSMYPSSLNISPLYTNQPSDGLSNNTQTTNRPMGFDRLGALGLDSTQIALFRSQFLPDVQADLGSTIPLEEGETEAHRLLRMEDAWMRVQGSNSDFAANIRPILITASASRLAMMMRASAASSSSTGGNRNFLSNLTTTEEEDTEALRGPAPEWRIRMPPSFTGEGRGNTLDDVPDGRRGSLSGFLCGMALGTMLGFM